MHLHKIADFMNFREAAIGGTIPETAKYREMLKKMHPLQMLSSNIVIPLFEISYSYTTIKGNHKNAKKYVFLQDHEEIDIEIELLMKDWVEDYNRQRPYRKISNVQILEIRIISFGSISIDH